MIAIITAMSSEADSIIDKYRLEQISDTIYKNDTLILSISGIGKIQATICLTQLLERYPHIHTVINAGVVGALDPALKRGQIITSDEVREHDGFLPDNIRDTDVYLPMNVTPAPVENIATGVIMTGDAFIQDEKKKDELHKSGGTVCDMECYAFAKVAKIYGKQFYVLKTVVDQREEDSSDYHKHLDTIAQTLPSTLEELIRGIL